MPTRMIYGPESFQADPDSAQVPAKQRFGKKGAVISGCSMGQNPLAARQRTVRIPRHRMLIMMLPMRFQTIVGFEDPSAGDHDLIIAFSQRRWKRRKRRGQPDNAFSGLVKNGRSG